MKNVLIVDDHDDTLRMMALLFRSQKFNVQIAINARQAKETLRAGGIDCVVTDYMMPDENGGAVKEVADELNVPCICVTGSIYQNEQFQYFFPKPVNIQALISKVKQILSVQ